MFTHDLFVRFSECDSLGHVNNAMYLTYFEEARKELFRIFNPDLNISSWNLILASTSCDFLQEVVYAQKLTVYGWISQLGTSSFQVEHAIEDEQGNWIARGKATLLQYDFTLKKAVPLSAEVRRALLEHSEGPAGVPALRS
ncbi:acyl-CoA thioesterase [Aneurinibacillus terranovensis]|uniref:acyl-CoA thioesterase n=1 Tax=Aneurinibacillus terranovensis TaxID=278991 RepID=UPI00041CBEF4|nr:thioesterase family protein [Aneurinibacillus terranovensis]